MHLILPQFVVEVLPVEKVNVTDLVHLGVQVARQGRLVVVQDG